MKTANVSFGKVIALSGKEAKLKRVNEKIAYKKQIGQVVSRDVTHEYVNAPSTGSLALAAQRGDRVEIYITGDDVKKFGKQDGWKTMDDVLSHLSAYYDVAKLSITEAVDKIFKG